MARLLEHAIDELEALDEQRERSRTLLAGAADSLLLWTKQKPEERALQWEPADADDVERAMVLRSLNYIKSANILKLSTSDEAEIDAETNKIRARLLRTTLASLYPEDKQSETDGIPVLSACLIIQALVEDEHSGPFCAPVLSCLYRVIDEVYEVGPPDWKMGGVRASEGSPRSAFVTREALRSILAFHECLANTAALLDELQKATDAWGYSEDAPKAWRVLDSNLRRRNFEISLHTRWPHLLNRSLAKPDDRGNWTDAAVKTVSGKLAQQWDNFKSHLAGQTLDLPESAAAEDGLRVDAHQKLQSVYDDAHKEPAADAAGSAASSVAHATDGETQQPPTDPGTPEAQSAASAGAGEEIDLRKAKGQLERAAACVLRIAAPAKVFLDTVLLGELSAELLRTSLASDVAQACFAAAGVAEFERASRVFDSEDPRWRAAAENASAALSGHGELPCRAPFDVIKKGYRISPQNTECLRALCDLLLASPVGCTAETARRLVTFFVRTRSDTPTKKPGWHSDTEPDKPAVWATALAFRGLQDLQRMLDAQINRQTLCHFTHRQPEQLKLDLSQLFISDSVQASRDEGKSLGMQLSDMRAHVSGIRSNDTFSVVFYGPPGTGKTTLLEAVAKSANVPIVEVTPSDILIGGREQIERHTRLVFSALSMLSECVILFDEFDSILYTREGGEGPPKTEFQFLTPGLLPKLKRLHDRAEPQRIAYALATNYLEHLDPAAIRSGRFDKRFGVFPPDLLSRIGRLATQLRAYRHERMDADVGSRAIEVINRAAGFGMAKLGKPGWFTALREGDPPAGPFGYACGDLDQMPDFGDPEAKRDTAEPKGKDDKPVSPVALAEWQEWTSIDKLDRQAGDLKERVWATFLKRAEKLRKAENERREKELQPASAPVGQPPTGG